MVFKRRILLVLAALSVIPMTGCSVARSLTTRRLDYSQNLIPTFSGGPITVPANSGGSVVTLPIRIVIQGEVRDKFDQYNGGVDSAFMTYRLVNTGDAPATVRMWANQPATGDACAFNASNPAIVEATIPANGSVTLTKQQGTNNPFLRSLAESILRGPATSSACLFLQGQSTDSSATIRIESLNIEGRAHGSLF